jgi:hypothetical protein
MARLVPAVKFRDKRTAVRWPHRVRTGRAEVSAGGSSYGQTLKADPEPPIWRPARTLGAVIGAAQIRAFYRSAVDSKCRPVLPGEPSLQPVTRGRWERVRWLMAITIVTSGAGDDLRCSGGHVAGGRTP